MATTIMMVLGILLTSFTIIILIDNSIEYSLHKKFVPIVKEERNLENPDVIQLSIKELNTFLKHFPDRFYFGANPNSNFDDTEYLFYKNDTNRLIPVRYSYWGYLWYRHILKPRFVHNRKLQTQSQIDEKSLKIKMQMLQELQKDCMKKKKEAEETMQDAVNQASKINPPAPPTSGSNVVIPHKKVDVFVEIPHATPLMTTSPSTIYQN